MVKYCWYYLHLLLFSSLLFRTDNKAPLLVADSTTKLVFACWGSQAAALSACIHSLSSWRKRLLISLRSFVSYRSLLVRYGGRCSPSTERVTWRSARFPRERSASRGHNPLGTRSHLRYARAAYSGNVGGSMRENVPRRDYKGLLSCY